MSTIQQIYGDLFVRVDFLPDLELAKRNRERIEQARQFEPPPVTRYYECGSGRFGPSKLKKMHYQRVPRSGYRKIAKDY
jgi:hypothetical protein